VFTRSGPIHINPKKGTLMTATMEAPQSTSLYYRAGSSDKEYHVRLEAKGDGFVVNTAFGRRGSTLSTGMKTSAPVSYDTALHIFERLVQEKQAKGYTAGANGTPYQPSANASQVSGLLPQLLNAVDEAQVARLVSDPRWAMQENRHQQARPHRQRAGDGRPHGERAGW
jgi:bifunctional non-homologous end joining protein LigD